MAMVVVAGLSIAGCGGGDRLADNPIQTGQPATSPPAPVAVASTGDKAACAAYERLTPQENEGLAIVASDGMSVYVMRTVFEDMISAIEGGMVAATDEDLKAAAAATVTGAKSAKATTDAWTSGDLNLSPDLQVLYEGSQQVVDACKALVPAGSYEPLMPPQ